MLTSEQLAKTNIIVYYWFSDLYMIHNYTIYLYLFLILFVQQVQNPPISSRMTINNTESTSVNDLYSFQSILLVSPLVYGDTGQFSCGYSVGQYASISAAVYVYVKGNG